MVTTHEGNQSINNKTISSLLGIQGNTELNKKQTKKSILHFFFHYLKQKDEDRHFFCSHVYEHL